MYTLNLNDYIKEHYTSLYHIYQTTDKQKIENLYLSLFHKNDIEKISQDGVYTLNSTPIKINNWKHELYLFVDLYDTLNFYLKSVVDLSDYVVELTQNKNFNQLILVIFYMMENIKAKS